MGQTLLPTAQKPRATTGLPEKTLRAVGRAVCFLPPTFNAHPAAAQLMARRLKAVESGQRVKWADAEGEEAVRQETVASNLLNMNKHACGNATKEGSQRSSLAGSQRSSLASGPMDDPGVEPPSAFSRAACHR